MELYTFCRPIRESEKKKPERIYKYRQTYDTGLAEIKECLLGNIRISYSDEFNDPFDSMYDTEFSTSWFCKQPPEQMYTTILGQLASIPLHEAVELLREIERIPKADYMAAVRGQSAITFDDATEILVQLLPKNKQVPPSKIQNLIEAKIRYKNPSFSCSYKIACFSENKDSIPMWAYYASASKGVCIEYNLMLLDNSNHEIKDHLFPVNYSNERPTDNYSTISDSYFWKSNEWKHEQEWRIVCASDKTHIELPCVSALYLGVYYSRNSETVKRGIYEYLCENDISVPIFKQYPNQSHFMLETREISLKEYARDEL